MSRQLVTAKALFVRPAGSNLKGFSLVEFALALGVVSFALVAMMALLPIGMADNQQSQAQTRASHILSLLEADLRHSFPGANGGRSQFFQLELPYETDAQGRWQHRAVTAGVLGTGATTGLDNAGRPVDIHTRPSPPFQASVIYITAPSSSGVTPLQARFIVNWPCLDTASASDLTDLNQVDGFAEMTVAFPAP